MGAASIERPANTDRRASIESPGSPASPERFESPETITLVHSAVAIRPLRDTTAQ
jgi:hypothetical protein